MLLAADAITISDWELLGRLAVAAGLGAAVGFERELRDREAGIRTHLAVSLGSALFTIVSAYGFAEFVGARLAGRPDADRGADRDRDRLPRRGRDHPLGPLRARAHDRGEPLDRGGGRDGGRRRLLLGRRVIGTAFTVFALGPLRIMAFRTLEPLRPAERRLVVELQAGHERRPGCSRSSARCARSRSTTRPTGASSRSTSRGARRRAARRRASPTSRT